MVGVELGWWGRISVLARVPSQARTQAIFINQIKAILRAGYYGEVKILLPMITNLSEVSIALKLIDKAKIILKTEKINFEAESQIISFIEALILLIDSKEKINFHLREK